MKSFGNDDSAEEKEKIVNLQGKMGFGRNEPAERGKEQTFIAKDNQNVNYGFSESFINESIQNSIIVIKNHINF